MVFLRFLFPMSFQKPIQKLGMDVCEVWQLKFWRKIQKWKICSKMTFCMNVSRFMNLAAIFSLDLESQFIEASINWDSRSSENMAAKFMKRDTFIQKVIFEQIFHFWIFLQNFNCHTSQTSIPNFCIGFWNDIGNKNLRKTIFDFYQFPVKIILVGLCLKA